jgi:hypothetical protein
VEVQVHAVDPLAGEGAEPDVARRSRDDAVHGAVDVGERAHPPAALDAGLTGLGRRDRVDGRCAGKQVGDHRVDRHRFVELFLGGREDVEHGAGRYRVVVGSVGWSAGGSIERGELWSATRSLRRWSGLG